MYSKRGLPLRALGHSLPTTGPPLPSPQLHPAGAAPTTPHAWAALEAGAPHDVPALVISWHRSPTGWQAWTVTLVDGQASALFLPAAQLRPADHRT